MFFLIAIFIAFVCIIGCTVLRYIHITTNIDQTTGFFIQQNVSVWMMWSMLIAAALLIWLAIFLQKNRGTRVAKSSLRIQGFLFFLSGVALSAQMILSPESTAYTGQKITMVVNSARHLCMALTCIVLLAVGVMCFVLKQDRKWVGNLMAIPALWCILSVSSALVNYATILPISQRMLDILFDLMMILFFVGVGRSFTKIHVLQGQKAIAYFGIIGGLAGIVAAFPIVLSQIVSGWQQVSMSGIADLILACTALWFGVIAAISLYKGKSKNCFVSEKRLQSSLDFFADQLDLTEK